MRGRTGWRAQLSDHEYYRSFGLPKKLRQAVFERDGWRCQYCCKERSEFRRITVDHYIAYRNGGTHELQNLITACNSCNCKKGILKPKEWLNKLSTLHETVNLSS